MQDWQLKDIYLRFLAWSKEAPEVLDYLPQITKLLNTDNLSTRHGEFKHWQKIIKSLENFGTASNFDLNSDFIHLQNTNLSAKAEHGIKQLLLNLSPWRKGPFDFYGVKVDSEWRSNLKWNRLAPHLDLNGKKVLDVGCGNGYYAWHCLGKGADLVLGIDPSLLFFVQFMALKQAFKDEHRLPDNAEFSLQQRIFYLPTTLEEMPEKFAVFDTALSMGVLYHRHSPIEHLQLLHKKLKIQGELILETLVIDGDENSILVPKSTYAGMPNVWFLPSIAMLKIWLEKTGFSNIQILDISFTTPKEQRATEFMQNLSLADFLNAEQSKTKEGLPMPQRVMLKAIKS